MVLQLLVSKLYSESQAIQDSFCASDGPTIDIEPQFTVNLGAHGIFDARDDPLHAKNVSCYLACHNIAVITTSSSDEDISMLDIGCSQCILVDGVASDRFASKRGWEADKGLGILINDRHHVACFTEHASKARANSTAPKNDNVHIAFTR
jgi:hypothetical protein